MSQSSGPGPIEAMERFLAGIAPFDPQPGVPVISIEIQAGRLRDRFELSDRATRALTELLLSHVDPDYGGSCGHCGGPLSKDLHCPGCDWVGGIFGQTVAQHAAKVAGRAETNQADA